jgi:hypothetical protein
MLFQNSTVWGKPGPRPSAPPAGTTNNPPAETGTEARAIFEGYAAKLGLDVERFRRDLNTEEVKARIKLDQERGASIGVDRTPFLLIDGVQIPFASFAETQLREVIDAALSGRPPSPPSPTPAAPQNPTSVQPPNPPPLPSPPK